MCWAFSLGLSTELECLPSSERELPPGSELKRLPTSEVECLPSYEVETLHCPLSYFIVFNRAHDI
jgi:hypothetical protein